MGADAVANAGPRLTLFDLDNTLLGGDSDYGWAQFLIEAGMLDAADYGRRNAQFFADYKAGVLDIRAFLEFQLQPLAAHDPQELLAWRERFLAEKIQPMLLRKGRAAVAERLAAGDLVAIVTATNSFITRPIADLYGVKHLVATEPELVGGRFTGRTEGIPCFQAGKLDRVRDWLAGLGKSLEGFASSWFYSDSHNDLALLSAVTHPVAVDPDPVLAGHAHEHGWPVVSWRET
jgi:HAD superfamily hydrolase (TIGR01490 family)